MSLARARHAANLLFPFTPRTHTFHKTNDNNRVAETKTEQGVSTQNHTPLALGTNLIVKSCFRHSNQIDITSRELHAIISF